MANAPRDRPVGGRRAPIGESPQAPTDSTPRTRPRNSRWHDRDAVHRGSCRSRGRQGRLTGRCCRGTRRKPWLQSASIRHRGPRARPSGRRQWLRWLPPAVGRTPPRAFDQQPVEATATIAACLTAWRADHDAEWKLIATRVFSWFLGNNDLSVALADPETGSCRDGLHPDRANENCGGESVVCYLLGLAEIRQLARVDLQPAYPAARWPSGFDPMLTLANRGSRVASNVSESAGALPASRPRARDRAPVQAGD